MKLPHSVLALSVILGLAGCSQPQQDSATGKPAAESAPAHVKLAPLNLPEQYQDYLNRDIRDDMFYFVLPDRFYNGNPDNDQGSKEYAISRGGFFPESKFGFHGGDMQGLEQKLDYLQDMGITAIWMTPILRNKATQGSSHAHHGYWIVDFTQIDPHFGSNDDLKSLIEAAHAKGIKIFFDIITNHTADVIKYEECHNPDGSFSGDWNECQYKTIEQVQAGDTYTPFIPVGEETAKTPAWLNDPKYYNNQGDSFWQGESAINGDFVGLDDIKTSDPEVVSGFIDIYKNIISEFKPDGFRIDTVKHVDLSFWQDFGPAIVEHAKAEGIPNFHIFGEVYSGDPAVLSSFTTSGKLPSVLDFGFQEAAADVLYRGRGVTKLQTLFENDDYYSDADSQADILMNFLGNHDMGRTGFFIEDGLPGISEEEKLQRSILSHVLMYYSRGVPVVYYGDEQGFTGDGGDVAARENMFPSQVDEYNDNNLLGTTMTTAIDNFDTHHPIYQAIRGLAQVRADHSTLRRGITLNRLADKRAGTYGFSRVSPQDRVEYLLLMNTSTREQTVSVRATSSGYQAIDGQHQFNVAAGKITTLLPGLSYLLLKADSPIAATTDFALVLSKQQETEQVKRYYMDLGGASGQVALNKVTFEFLNAAEEVVESAIDFAPPYSAVIRHDVFDAVEAKKLRVTADNLAGKQVTRVYDIANGEADFERVK